MLKVSIPIKSQSGNKKIYKLTSVLYASVLFLIKYEFRQDIGQVPVAADPRGVSQVDPPTTLIILWRNSSSITGPRHEKLTSI